MSVLIHEQGARGSVLLAQVLIVRIIDGPAPDRYRGVTHRVGDAGVAKEVPLLANVANAVSPPPPNRRASSPQYGGLFPTFVQRNAPNSAGADANQRPDLARCCNCRERIS